MATVSEFHVEAASEELADKRQFSEAVMIMLLKQPLASFGAAIVLATIFMAVFADVITSIDPEENNLEFMLTAPG